jgi:hypothetical protein
MSSYLDKFSASGTTLNFDVHKKKPHRHPTHLGFISNVVRSCAVLVTRAIVLA